MNARISMLIILLISILSLSSCTTQEDVTTYNDKYLDLYKTTYTNLRNALASTRTTDSFQGEVTRDEIASINSLGILVSYDKTRLVEIEASDVYQEMKLNGEIHLQENKAKFLQNHSLPEYGKILSFTENYIKKGTHSSLVLEQALDQENKDEIKQYMALCAAVVDAYGEEEIWKETFEIASFTPCDQTMIVAVVSVIGLVALDLIIDSSMPWATFVTMVNTVNSLCKLVTIHNDWVRCKKNEKKP